MCELYELLTETWLKTNVILKELKLGTNDSANNFQQVVKASKYIIFARVILSIFSRQMAGLITMDVGVYYKKGDTTDLQSF